MYILTYHTNYVCVSGVVCGLVWCVDWCGVWTGVVCGLVWCMDWCGAWTGVVRGLVWCMDWCGVWTGVVHGLVWCTDWCGAQTDVVRKHIVVWLCGRYLKYTVCDSSVLHSFIVGLVIFRGWF